MGNGKSEMGDRKREMESIDRSIDLEPLWSCFEVTLVLKSKAQANFLAYEGHFGALGGPFGATLGHFGMTLGPPRGDFGTLWDDFGVTLGPLKAYEGDRRPP